MQLGNVNYAAASNNNTSNNSNDKENNNNDSECMSYEEHVQWKSTTPLPSSINTSSINNNNVDCSKTRQNTNNDEMANVQRLLNALKNRKQEQKQQLQKSPSPTLASQSPADIMHKCAVIPDFGGYNVPTPIKPLTTTAIPHNSSFNDEYLDKTSNECNDYERQRKRLSRHRSLDQQQQQQHNTNSSATTSKAYDLQSLLTFVISGAKKHNIINSKKKNINSSSIVSKNSQSVKPSQFRKHNSLPPPPKLKMNSLSSANIKPNNIIEDEMLIDEEDLICIDPKVDNLLSQFEQRSYSRPQSPPNSPTPNHSSGNSSTATSQYLQLATKLPPITIPNNTISKHFEFDEDDDDEPFLLNPETEMMLSQIETAPQRNQTVTVKSSKNIDTNKYYPNNINNNIHSTASTTTIFKPYSHHSRNHSTKIFQNQQKQHR